MKTKISSPIKQIEKQLIELYTFAEEDDPSSIVSNYPQVDSVIKALQILIDILIPGKYTAICKNKGDYREFLNKQLGKAFKLLNPQLKRALKFRWLGVVAKKRGAKKIDNLNVEIDTVKNSFILALPEIRKFIIEDINAAYKGDPAALTFAEIQLAYPGILAICSHRIANIFYKLNVPIIPRIMSEWTHTQTGTDINPGATIGHGFFIDHCTGVVIGETTEIGNNVKIYQGATLGAKSFPLDQNGQPIKGIKRHPTVEDEVVIYANATVLGGDTVIGKGSTIGAGVFLMQSVAENSIVVSKNPELLIQSKINKKIVQH